MKKNLSPVLERLFAACGATTPAEVARRLRMPAANVRKWVFRGEVPVPALVEAAQITGHDMRWLVTGEGPRFEWQAEDPVLADAVQAELARHDAAKRAGRPDMPLVLREPDPPPYGNAPAANDSATLVPLSPREYALIANYRAAPDSEKPLIERTSAALAQRAPKVSPPSNGVERKRKERKK